jgi:hypothetical protein
MRLIITGCEYTGKTTLARGIRDWIHANMGEPEETLIHDHFLPHVGEGGIGRFTAEEEEREFFALKPFALEKYMRYMIHYHAGDHFYQDNDHLVVNWYYSEAVYAPLYFGYGRTGEYADRRELARSQDMEVMHKAPDTVLLHLTATAEAIRQRMQAEPRPGVRFRDEDIELILNRFEEEFSASLLRCRVKIDTTNLSLAELLPTAIARLEPYFTQVDRLRLLTHRVLHTPGAS